VTLPPGVNPQMGTDWSPVGQIYFFTLHSTNPAYDAMELKSLEDWVVEKSFKSVPNIVDVASFGGPTREYQVRVDPNKLIAYGLSLAQVEQQLTNNNVNAAELYPGRLAADQRALRRFGGPRQDIERTVIVSKNGTPLRVKDIAVVSQVRRFGSVSLREPFTARTVRSSITTMWSRASCCCAKARPARLRSRTSTRSARTQRSHLAAGSQDRPFLDRSLLVHYTTHTVLHNLTEGMILVSVILLLFLGNVRGAVIVAATIPFALLLRPFV